MFFLLFLVSIPEKTGPYIHLFLTYIFIEHLFSISNSAGDMVISVALLEILYTVYYPFNIYFCFC